MQACYGNACRGAGYYFETMTYCNLSACGADNNGVGYLLSRCQGVSLTGCGAESTKASGDSIYNDGTSFRVDQCDTCELSPIWTWNQNATGVRISGNSRRIRVLFKDNQPGPTALQSIKVDTGSELI